MYLVALQIGYSVMPRTASLCDQLSLACHDHHMAKILLKEKLNVGKWCTILLSFLGVVIVVLNGDISQLSGGTLGGVIACDPCNFYVYSAMSKKMRYDTERFFYFCFCKLNDFVFCCSGDEEENNPTVFTGTRIFNFGLFTNGIALFALDGGIKEMAIRL